MCLNSGFRAHGHSFHTSIWYVQLNGVNDQHYMDEVLSKHEEVSGQACHCVFILNDSTSFAKGWLIGSYSSTFASGA